MSCPRDPRYFCFGILFPAHRHPDEILSLAANEKELQRETPSRNNSQRDI